MGAEHRTDIHPIKAIAVLTAFALASLVTPASATPAPPVPAADNPAGDNPAGDSMTFTSIEGGSEAERDIVAEALDRFDDNGLTLPPLRITIHERDKSFCHGSRAFWQKGDGVDTVGFCFVDRMTALHELAHAWEHHEVTDSGRAAFLELTPGQVWRSGDVSHNRQGIEDVANTVARVLAHDDLHRLDPQDPADVAAVRLLIANSADA